MVRKAERSLRHWLSDWHFWMVVAYIGLAGLVVGLYFVRSTAAEAKARRDADDRARVVAARLKVAQCKASIPQLRKITRFVVGVEEFHRILAENTRQLLASTPKTDPQYAVRKANYLRIAKTVADVSGVRFHIPTPAECDALGRQQEAR